MGLMDELGGLLKRYEGTPGERPSLASGDGYPNLEPGMAPALGDSASGNVEQDFNRVAPHVPQSSMASGISNVFRSDQTAPFGQMISQMFGQSNGDQRAGILNQLLAVGGGALVNGEIGSLLRGGRSVTPEMAQQISPASVQDLADKAQQHDPSVVDRAGEFYAQHPTLVQGLGAGALALLMSHLSSQRS